MNYFRDLTGKEKVQYIWDYYKVHIIASIAIFFLLSSFTYSQLTKPNYIFNITYMGQPVDEVMKTDFAREVTSVVGGRLSKRDTALVDIFPINSLADANQGVNPQLMQKLFAETAAGDIDIIIMDKSIFNNFVNDGALTSIENSLSADTVNAKFEKVNDGIYGLNIDDNKVLKSFGFETKDKVLCIMGSSKRKDKAAEVIKWLQDK